jgi:hypothetical protein
VCEAEHASFLGRTYQRKYAYTSCSVEADNERQGLDGQGALNIIKLLRRLADHGQSIICTIHQANQEQFELVSEPPNTF